MKNFAVVLLLLSACLIVPDAAFARPGDGGPGPRFHNNHIRGAMPRVNHGPRMNHGPRINHGNFGPRANHASRPHFGNPGPRMNHGSHGNYGPRTNYRPAYNNNPSYGPRHHGGSFLPRVFGSNPHQRNHRPTFMNNFPRSGSRNSHNFNGDPAAYRGAPYQNFRGYNEGRNRGSFRNYLPGGNPFPPRAPVTSYNFNGDPAFYQGAPYQNFRGYNGGFGF